MDINTTITFFNQVDAPTSNQILIFLQPEGAQDNYLFSAWDVLNPAIGSHASAQLSTQYSGSIATFGDTRGTYSDPVEMPLGQALGITNPNNQSPVIGGPDPSSGITSDEVGLANNCLTPPTDLSVAWYINGSRVVETNNTATTTLNPGFISTFQLKQAIFCMLAQVPTEGTTFTLQSFGRMTAFPIPNGAPEVNILVKTVGGIDQFELSPKSFDELIHEGLQVRRVA